MTLLIKNGTVVSSKETKKANIYVKDGKIVEILLPDEISSFQENEINKVIDATGKLVIPGGIDVHTHLDMPFMGTKSTDDFYTGTVAAAYGGTTSIIDYIIPQKNQSLTDAYNIWEEKAETKAVIDYGFHMAIIPPIENVLSDIAKLSELGITSIKCFLAYKNALMIDDSSLFKLFKETKKHNILVCIHAENGEIIDVLTKDYLEQGKTKPIYHALSRPAILEAEAISRVLKIAKLAETPVYFVHLSSKEGIKEVKKAKKEYQRVYAETCPQYLLLEDEKYIEKDFEGAKYVMSPPLRKYDDRKALLKALDKGFIDVIATDHCPFNYNNEKQLGKDDFTKIPNGIPGIETRMSIMFTEMVVKNDMSLNEFVLLNCTRPAQIFGCIHKGDIETGMDADIVIWNPTQKWTIKKTALHENVDYTAFEGYKATGKAVTVISRGKLIIENENFVGNAGDGLYIQRKNRRK